MAEYGYARVSTVQQDLHEQLEALKKAGVPEGNIFAEKFSGANTNRPKWRLLEGDEKADPVNGLIKPGDTLFVHKLDRLGRSVSDVTRIIDKFERNGIFLVVITQGIDTRVRGTGMEAMMTKCLITILSLMAEMERTFILERTRPAIAAAKESGVRFGAKRKDPKNYIRAIEMYLTNKHMSIPQVLKEFNGLSQATFMRRLKELRTIREYLNDPSIDINEFVVKEGLYTTTAGTRYYLKEDDFKKLIDKYQPIIEKAVRP